MQVQLLVRNVTSKTHVRSSSGSPKLTHSCASVGALVGGTPRRYRLRTRTLLIVAPERSPHAMTPRERIVIVGPHRGVRIRTVRNRCGLDEPDVVWMNPTWFG